MKAIATRLGALALIGAVACGGDATETAGGPHLYVWAGPRRGGDGLGTPPGNDVLVTIDGDTGQVVHVLDVGSANNEPHHTMRCGARLLAGGLFSGRIFVFELAEPGAPALAATIEGTDHGLGVADDFLCLSDGRVLVTMMGNAEGRSPGGLLAIAPDLTVAAVYPVGAPPDLNPHGIDVDEPAGLLVTTDLMELASVAAVPPAPIVRDTVRLWDLASMAITDTVQVCAGPMEARFFRDGTGRILVCCMVAGEFGVVARDEDGAWRYRPSLDIDGGDDLVASPGGIELADGTLWVALSGYGEVRRYDLADAASPALVGTAIVGPGAHYMTFGEDGARGYVSDYVVERLESVTGMSPADNRVWRFDAATMQAEVVIDFQRSDDPSLAGRLPLQPHGLAVR